MQTGKERVQTCTRFLPGLDERVKSLNLNYADSSTGVLIRPVQQVENQVTVTLENNLNLTRQ